MNLLELVSYYRDGRSYEEFCISNSLDQESEVIEIYMEQPLQIYGELGFFEIEKTDGVYEYISDGIKYSNLFDFFYFLDVIKESNNPDNRHLTDDQIAKILFDYAINDV